MPRFRNLFDYNSGDKVHKPRETLIDVPITDSVNIITINFEDGGFVQLRRIEGVERELNEWKVVTSLDVEKASKNVSMSFAR